MNKRQAQKRHARRRALERYGINLGPHTHTVLVGQIRNGTSRFVARQSHRVTVHDVTVDDRTLRVVYDTLRGQIVTVLPPDGDRLTTRSEAIQHIADLRTRL